MKTNQTLESVAKRCHTRLLAQNTSDGNFTLAKAQAASSG